MNSHDELIRNLEKWEGYGWVDGKYYDSLGEYLKKLQEPPLPVTTQEQNNIAEALSEHLGAMPTKRN